MLFSFTIAELRKDGVVVDGDLALNTKYIRFCLPSIQYT
jgi:hypothetical protein